MMNDLDLRKTRDKPDDLIHHLVYETSIVRDRRHTENRFLPEILLAHLCNRHIEPVFDLGFNALQDLPLSLQRAVLGMYSSMTQIPTTIFVSSDAISH